MRVLVPGLVTGGGATVVDVVVVVVLVDVDVDVDVVDVVVVVLEVDEVVGGSAAGAGAASASPSVRPASGTTAHGPWRRSRLVSATHPPQARVDAGDGDPRAGL